jgi:hypothetical protein
LLQLEALAANSGSHKIEQIQVWGEDTTHNFEVMSDDDQGVTENGS